MTLVSFALGFLSGCVFVFVLLVWLGTKPKALKRLGLAPMQDRIKNVTTLN